MNSRIYLDHNAGTSIDPRVLDVMIQELKTECGNPSSIHTQGQQARLLLENSRAKIAQFFKVKPQEIIFTSSGTEGANLLINGILSRHATGHVITSVAEHACVYQMAQACEKKGFEVSFLETGEWGAVTPEVVLSALRPDTRLIVLTAVNNETGVKTDWESVAEIAFKAGIPFVLDGVALLGKEAFQLTRGVSAVFFSGHKIHAPKGIGFCVCRQTLKINPLFLGGNQEYLKRAGSENLSGIVGLAEAITLLSQEQEEMTHVMRDRRDLLEKGLKSSFDVVVNGKGPRVVNTVNVSFRGVDGESLLLKLDMAGIAVSHGSACSSGAMEPSRVLLKMGVSLELARSAIRFSVAKTTTEEEIGHVIETLKKILLK